MYDGNRYIGKAEVSDGKWEFPPKITSPSVKINLTTVMGGPKRIYTGIDIQVDAVSESKQLTLQHDTSRP